MFLFTKQLGEYAQNHYHNFMKYTIPVITIALIVTGLIFYCYKETSRSRYAKVCANHVTDIIALENKQDPSGETAAKNAELNHALYILCLGRNGVVSK